MRERSPATPLVVLHAPMLPLARSKCILAGMLVAATLACRAADNPAPNSTTPFGAPQRVVIRGYDGDAMEPFITRDGRYLLFNNRNEPRVNTNLHYAERVDDTTFEYRGEIEGVNTPALEGVPSLDREGTLYFVSNRSYDTTFSTIYRGHFVAGRVSAVELVNGVSRDQRAG